MSVTRTYGNVELICDGCEESFDTQESSFVNAMSRAFQHGWRAVKDGDGWQHYCTDACKNANGPGA